LGAAYYGGDIGESMLQGAGIGAVGGAAFGGIDAYFGKTWNLYRVGAYTGVGSGLSTLGGGKFEDGAMMAGGAAFLAYGYNKLFAMPPDGRVATKDANLEREQAPGHYYDTNNTEHALFGKAGCTGFLCEGNPGMQSVAKNAPWVQQGSVLHDWMVDVFPKALQWVVLPPTIPVAIAATLGGALAVHAPVAAPVALGLAGAR
jgi:hypothetical protein